MRVCSAFGVTLGDRGALAEHGKARVVAGVDADLGGRVPEVDEHRDELDADLVRAFGLRVSRRLVCGQGARRPRDQVVPRLDELTLDVGRLEPLAHQRITLGHALPPRTLDLSVELGDCLARAPLGLDRGRVRLTRRVGRRTRRPRLGELRRQHLGIGLALHPLLERGALPDERLARATRRGDGVLRLRHPIPSARLGLAGGLERLPRPVGLAGAHLGLLRDHLLADGTRFADDEGSDELARHVLVECRLVLLPRPLGLGPRGRRITQLGTQRSDLGVVLLELAHDFSEVAMGVERGLDLGRVGQRGRRRFGLGQGACGCFLGIRGLTLRRDCPISFRLQRPHRLWHAQFAKQGHDSARALSRRDCSFHRGLQLGCPRLCVRQLLAQLADGIELTRRFVERLRRAVCVLLDHPHIERDLVLLLVGKLCRTAAHPLVDAEVEQLDEEVLPVGRLVVQELGELPLGEDHAPREVVERQSDELGDRGVHPFGVTGEHVAAALEPRLLRRRAPRLRTPHDPRRDVLGSARARIATTPWPRSRLA